MVDTFSCRRGLSVNGREYQYFSLPELGQKYDINRLPFSLKILLENLLRNENGVDVTPGDIGALCQWEAKAEPSTEIAFTPSRVVLQDFTGVPAVVDLAAMRDAMAALGGDPNLINPLAPAELVVDQLLPENHGIATSVGRHRRSRGETAAIADYHGTALESGQRIEPLTHDLLGHE